MRALAAIIFDFDGVIADCRRGVLLPGAASFVRRAADAVPIGIASGALTHDIERLLTAHGLLGLFGAVIGADQTASSKPSPDPFLAALHRLTADGHTIDPARVVAIDDSLWGLVAAHAAGLRCVGVTTDDQRQKFAPHTELIVPGLHALSLDTLDTLVQGAGRPGQMPPRTEP